jgi:hypothetical protein
VPLVKIQDKFQFYRKTSNQGQKKNKYQEEEQDRLNQLFEHAFYRSSRVFSLARFSNLIPVQPVRPLTTCRVDILFLDNYDELTVAQLRLLVANTADGPFPRRGKTFCLRVFRGMSEEDRDTALAENGIVVPGDEDEDEEISNLSLIQFYSFSLSTLCLAIHVVNASIMYT